MREVCGLVASILDGAARREIVARLASARDFRSALAELRVSMLSGEWTAPGTRVSLGPALRRLDAATRREGFHVLHDWDGIADRVNENTIPVDVLDDIALQRGAEAPDRAALAILIDYYFLYVLALLSMRVWDDGAADANLETLGALLATLQGPQGSGHRFASDAETLILVATSHYELDERGFGALLDRVRSLPHERQVRAAVGHAVAMGCHLRFGLQATYGGDVAAMRTDNAADYPWLRFSIETLANEYSARPDPAIAEALVNALSADPAATRDAPVPPPAAFERWRPSERAYSPLNLFFNFSHNVLKGTVIDALTWGDPRPFALNDLLTAVSRDDGEDKRKRGLAATLMDYARANPHRIRGTLMPVIVYDPAAGRRAFSETIRALDYVVRGGC